MDSYDDLITRDDIQVIVNTGPHFLHARETIKAAQAGKHVVCEKPLGMNWQEICDVRDAVNKAKVQFQCGLSLRWSPFVKNLKSLLDKGQFGKLFYMEADYFHSLGSWWNGFSWGGQKRSGGPSASLVAGIHAVDLMRYLCGEVAEVHAYGTHGNREYFEYEPTYMAALQFENGAVGKTSCSFEVESPYLMNFLLHGSRGSVANEKFYFGDLFPGQQGWQTFNTVMPDSGAVSHHPFKTLIDDFIKAIDTNGTTVLNIDEMWKTHELCIAIDRSIETKKAVNLPLETE